MNKDQLKNLIKKSLKIKAINSKTSSKNTAAWDSLGHLSILSALDKTTKGKTSKLNLSKADSFTVLFKILKKNKI